MRARVHTLDGTCSTFDVSAEDTVRDLKCQVARHLNQATSRMALLCGPKLLDNDEPLSGLEQVEEGALELQLAYLPVHTEVTSLELIAATDGRALKALEKMVQRLEEAGVKQGQVLSVDVHNRSKGADVTATAYCSRDLPGRGALRLAVQTHSEIDSWEKLHTWADEEAVGKDVVGITGVPTQSDWLFLAVISYEGEVTPTARIQHVTTTAHVNGWDVAAKSLIHKLNGLGVQRGQLLSIDAHVQFEDCPPKFTAHYCLGWPGFGPLGLDFRCHGNDGSPWFCFEENVIKQPPDGRLVSATGSANDEGSVVMYSFFYIQGDPMDMCLVSAPSWEEAAAKLCGRLSELGIDRRRLTSVDAHNNGHGTPCTVCAHYLTLKDTEEAGPPLQASAQVVEIPRPTERPCATARESGKDVLSITSASGEGKSDSSGIFCLLFYDDKSTHKPDIRVVESRPCDCWDMAAVTLLDELCKQGVPRHQIVNIDACTLHPDAPAQFFAHVDSSREGKSPAGKVAFIAFNEKQRYEDLHRYMSTKGWGKDVISITGCSNESGRAVLYMFFWKPTS